jgi:uncharacterized protein (TIGR02246 family)
MIRSALLGAVVLLSLPSSITAQTRVADSSAIVQLVRHHVDAMRHRQAELQRSIYAPDAVWNNAFGRRQTGVDSIVAFLRGLYADSGYVESRLVNEAPPEVFFLRPDVAVVHEYHEREGQRLADGRVLNRRVHTTFVVSKEVGRWLIRYQQISDERDRAPAH